MRLCLETIAQACGTQVPAEKKSTAVTSVVTDSRRAVPGTLFVCIPGERVDGHDFAVKAVENGACAVLAQRPIPELARAHPDVPVLMVPDTVKGLCAAATAWRKTFRGKLVSLTGTAGKTTVKELLYNVLSLAGKAHKTDVNHNNQVGMPLDMLQAQGDEDFWIMEAGISHKGDMDELGAVMLPDSALVVNAGVGHTEGLGEMGVAWNKARLFLYLAEGGMGTACGDYPELVENALKNCPDVRFFSTKKGSRVLNGQGRDVCVCHAEAVESGEEGDTYRISFAADEGRPASEITCATTLRGESGAEDCAAAALVCRRLGVADSVIAGGLERPLPQSQRSAVKKAGNFYLVDSTYNANPLSMGRTLRATADRAQKLGLPLVCVLGHMGELGAKSESSHTELGSLLASLHPAAVFWKGGREQEVRNGLARGGYAGSFAVIGGEAAGREAFASWLSPERKAEGAVVLFKGSRLNRLEDALAVFRDLTGAEGAC